MLVAATTAITQPDTAVAGGTVAAARGTRPSTTLRDGSTATIAPTMIVTLAMRLVDAARSQVGVTTGYDPRYVGISYPGGDVPLRTGVCSDVVVRALRGVGIDLQVRIHQDMKVNFSKYPRKWGLKKPDTNIDHRRVPNIATYFTRRGYALPVTANPADYSPGDIVAMKIPVDHIGIVSDRTTAAGMPLVIHNVGNGTQEEDVLFAWQIVGHYRVVN
jgi:uncharacterized protein